MKNDSPVVSVVIPALDAAVTLLETLQSVSLQTYPNLDVIVVDDGSTDGTADLVRQYGISDPRVRLLQKPNGGAASARNEGVRAGKGQLIAVIDADNPWHPTKSPKQVAILSAGEAGRMNYCGSIRSQASA